MATTYPAGGMMSGPRTLRKATGWYMAMAVVFILIGWLFIFGGVAHVIAAFSRAGARVFWGVILGVLYILGGLYLLAHPLLGLGTLTLLLAGLIFAEGVLELIGYFRMPKEGRSAWMAANGVITLLLGGLIWLHWPSSSVWAIGILVGVNLLTTGLSRLMVGMEVRKIARGLTG